MTRTQPPAPPAGGYGLATIALMIGFLSQCRLPLAGGRPAARPTLSRRTGKAAVGHPGWADPPGR